MDTALYDASIPAIVSLQDALSNQAGLMQLLSTVFDPKYAFLIYSPIAFLIDQRIGKKLIMTTVIAEWLNMILKWFLHGERPYWYVHSSGHFESLDVKQFPSTCELGPGHPSGHSMLTAAVWYVIFSSALEAYNRNKQATVRKQSTVSTLKSPAIGVWSIYALLLVTIAISRVFLGCHFPHQCLAGAALGIVVAKVIMKYDIKPWHFVGASPCLLVTAFGSYGLLLALGFDPSWTIKLATTHCIKREYIHLDTAPFFSIMRYCGFALGCGLGLLLPLKPYAANLIPIQDSQRTSLDSTLATPAKDDEKLSSSLNITWFPFRLLMALLIARLVENLNLFVSHSNLPIFYSSAFFAYTAFSYTFINL